MALHYGNRQNPPEGAEGVFILREKDIHDMRTLANDAKPGDKLHIVFQGGGWAMVLEMMEPDEPKRLTWRDKDSLL